MGCDPLRPVWHVCVRVLAAMPCLACVVWWVRATLAACLHVLHVLHLIPHL